MKYIYRRIQNGVRKVYEQEGFPSWLEGQHQEGRSVNALRQSMFIHKMLLEYSLIGKTRFKSSQAVLALFKTSAFYCLFFVVLRSGLSIYERFTVLLQSRQTVLAQHLPQPQRVINSNY